jgi:DNA modification methylase
MRRRCLNIVGTKYVNAPFHQIGVGFHSLIRRHHVILSGVVWVERVVRSNTKKKE